jgi:hypothetical protein
MIDHNLPVYDRIGHQARTTPLTEHPAGHFECEGVTFTAEGIPVDKCPELLVWPLSNTPPTLDVLQVYALAVESAIERAKAPYVDLLKSFGVEEPADEEVLELMQKVTFK